MSFSATRLRDVRLQLGRSQRDVRAVAQATLSAIESGRQRPHPSTLRKLAEEYGVEVRDFFEEVEETPKGQPVSPSPEWALAAPDNEFDNWIETADTTALHKFWNMSGNYARGIEDAERRAHLLARVQKAIDQFFRLNPIEGIVDRRPQQSSRHDDTSSEAG